MDKVTRMLRLYSQLAQGKKVNKLNFCMEVDCLERTFDRDIEDIRLYLSEFFCNQELVYIRSENVYCFTNYQRYFLEAEEYLLLERLLLDSKLLKGEELQELLRRMASNTDKAKQMSEHGELQMQTYDSPTNTNISLKLFYDLMRVIENQWVIRFVYPIENKTVKEYEVVPYRLEYKNMEMKLIATSISCGKNTTMEFELSKIDSFSIIGKRMDEE